MCDFLFISTNVWTPWGGSEVLWYKTAIMLKNNGYHISAYLKQWNPIPFHYMELLNAGVEIKFHENNSNNARPTWLKKVLKRIKIKLKINYDREDWLNMFNPNHVIISLGDHQEGLNLTSRLRKKGMKYSLIVQLAKESHIPYDNLWESFKEQYTNATKVYFVSKQNRDIIEIACATKLNNAEIIFNPFIWPSVVPKFPSFESYRMALVGTLTIIHKGQDLILEVLSKDKWRKRNLILNLYGRGKNENYLKGLVNFFSLDKVVFHDFEQSKAKIWSENHVLILPSRMEGMSLALLEAIAYERVPIVTNVGGAREIIMDNETGFIAKAPTVEFIDEVLERAWQQRKKWESIGKKGADYLKKLVFEDPIKSFSCKLENLIS